MLGTAGTDPRLYVQRPQSGTGKSVASGDIPGYESWNLSGSSSSSLHCCIKKCVN